jgi:pyruvate/2-oxoglutarate dehydrogenase complex dihydrolipoamide dehydrogenase (E3) component
MTATAPGRATVPALSSTVWDLLVVGAGSAGLVGARTAASLGASVLLVERDRTGGDCLWTGCVPSKALLAAADLAADVRRAGRLGVHAGDVRVDFAAVLRHVRAAIDAIEPDDSPDALRRAGVAVQHGTARFTGPRSAEVDGAPVRFRQALIATGSRPAVPPIPGLAAAGPLTSETVWDLTELPARLAVLGGGTIGCELGQAFARLGAAVTVLEGADRLLPAEDPDASRLVTEALTGDGATVLAGAPVVEVAGTALVLAGGRRVEADAVLVAVGRRPDTAGLDPQAAGVELDGRGFVAVDERLRTGNPRIWAAGDVTGQPQFTHSGGVHGSVAAGNAVLGLRRRADQVIPRVTLTSPEVAAVGAPTDGGHPGRVHTVPHRDVDRAVAEGHTAGFTRLVVGPRGRIAGATVVGPRAGETLAELTLAVRRGLRTRDLAGSMHPYPTYGDGPWSAAIGDVRSRLAAPAARGVTRALALARRRWLDRRR